jgi:hypothetical protein
MIDAELLRDLTEYCFDALEQCDDTTNRKLIDALDQLLDAIATYRKEGRKKAQGNGYGSIVTIGNAPSLLSLTKHDRLDANALHDNTIE